ncbi:MAG: YceI family protein, partial [Phycisphaerales bacterium]|nr:YceI family protein [Phycisphaerales bacterium]
PHGVEAFAQSAPAVTPQTVAASIKLDAVHSAALFRIQHLGAGFFWGRFNALEGTVQWPLDNSAVPMMDVTAKVANIDTSSEKLDANLQGPNFFNAKEFPDIHFHSTGGTRTSEHIWRIEGDLTLRGVTKSVAAECLVAGIGKGPMGKKVGFECTLTIKRSDFGMSWGIEKPPKMLGDEVRLIIALEGDEVKTPTAD